MSAFPSLPISCRNDVLVSAIKLELYTVNDASCRSPGYCSSPGYPVKRPVAWAGYLVMPGYPVTNLILNSTNRLPRDVFNRVYSIEGHAMCPNTAFFVTRLPHGSLVTQNAVLGLMSS